MKLLQSWVDWMLCKVLWSGYRVRTKFCEFSWMNDDLEKRTCCTVINLNEIFISYGMSVGELMLRFIEKNLIVIFIFIFIFLDRKSVV